MTPRFFGYLGIFLVMQVIAQLILKKGSEGGASMRHGRWWWGFLGANAVGAPSVWFLKELYRALPDSPNLVAVIVLAGVFMLTQLTFIVLFRMRLTVRQGVGVALLATGAILASFGA